MYSDHGAAAANALARRLVAPAHRGGQAQDIESAASERPEASLAPVLDWMRAHLHEPLTIPALARQASPANFRRHFTAAVGVSPSAYRRAFRQPAR